MKTIQNHMYIYNHIKSYKSLINSYENRIKSYEISDVASSTMAAASLGVAENSDIASTSMTTDSPCERKLQM